MADDDKPLSIIAYRVEEMERRLEGLMVSISAKLDKIGDNQSQITSKLVGFEVEMGVIKKAVGDSQDKLSRLEHELFNVKLSMAEKVIPGALAGGGLAAIIEIVRHLVGN